MTKVIIWTISIITLGAIAATGVVEPENEVLLLSPASSIITNIFHDVGGRVEKGDVILQLDDEPIKMQIEQIEDQIEVKNNNLEKTILNAKNVRVDLDYNVEVKKLKIISIKSELVDQEQLLEVGGISPARFEKTKQELTLAEKDLETLQAKNTIRLQQLATEEKGLKLQIEIQKKELDQKKELLSKMEIKAPSSGIILQIDGKEGEKVNTDRLLVRMSDLTTFKLSASIEDIHSEIAKTGRDVLAIVDQERLSGKIGQVSPTIKEGKIEFDVFLDQNNYSRLRPNMDVNLLVIEASKDSVLRVKKGEAFGSNSNIHDIYVVKAEKASLKKVKTGLSGNDFYEIEEGANAGDELIISSNASFRKLQEIELN
jgi:HlyD family secretion protein